MGDQDKPLQVTWQGETYRLADKIGDWPWIRFGKIAASGVDANELEGAEAIYDVLENCLAPEDWRRFQAHATRLRSSGDEIMELVNATYQAVSGRPTARPAVSSAGPLTTQESSAADSSSPVMRVLDSIPDSRRDLKLAVWESHQQQTG